MEWLADILRANPVIPVFLTIGLGFWIGRLKLRSFMPGPVAATLVSIWPSQALSLPGGQYPQSAMIRLKALCQPLAIA